MGSTYLLTYLRKRAGTHSLAWIPRVCSSLSFVRKSEIGYLLEWELIIFFSNEKSLLRFSRKLARSLHGANVETLARCRLFHLWLPCFYIWVIGGSWSVCEWPVQGSKCSGEDLESFLRVCPLTLGKSERFRFWGGDGGCTAVSVATVNFSANEELFCQPVKCSHN